MAQRTLLILRGLLTVGGDGAILLVDGHNVLLVVHHDSLDRGVIVMGSVRVS
jgi:hypothetical protein